MKDLKYQNKYTKQLIDASVEYLEEQRAALIVFQAPTGSGKTIMLADGLSRIVKKLQNHKRLSFVWISVNALHEQSKEKLEKYFENEKLLECVSINEIQNNCLNENEILFVNWESLNKEDNLFIKDNERDWNLSKVVENTKDEDGEIVLIIDESHRAAKTSKSKEIINIINPKLTIEVSATPKEGFTNDRRILVPLKDVIKEEMIKQEIQLNPGLYKIETNEDIVKAALKRRRILHKYYKAMGTKINPLVLIQIPNKKSTDARSPEDKIIEVLEKQGISTQNGKLAIWLSQKEYKIHLDYLEKDDGEVEVLIFKQAIAQGWDCPRASILLLQREWNTENYIFNVQTLGRIMRMPEQKHYEKYPDLNVGYVYTASDNFSIVEDLAKDYVSKVQMMRDNTIYKNIYLPSQHIRRKREKQRLSSDFKKCIFKAADKLKIKKGINAGPVKFKKDIGVNGQVEDIDRIQDVSFKSKKKIYKDREEICAWYTSFIKSQTFPFTGGNRPTSIIKSSLRSLFKRDYGIDNEDRIASIVLNPNNNEEFIELIDKAKERFKKLPEKEDIVTDYEDWQIPEAISVFDNFKKVSRIKKSVLKPYYVKKDKNDKDQWSKPEKTFIDELGKTDDDVLWWFKNGERESKFFGIAYKKEKGRYGFYPDFIIKTKRETIVVEIKDDKDFRNENLLKLNAGKEYQKKHHKHVNLYFFIISLIDYRRFFKALKDLQLDNFKSMYEQNLLKYTQSRKINSKSTTDKSREDQELLDLYEGELDRAVQNLDDKKLENEILRIDLQEARNFIQNIKTTLAYQRKPKKDKEITTLNIRKPFNICIFGEVANRDIIRKEIRNYFAKYDIKANSWDVAFYNNTKLRKSDTLSGLRKGQTKFQLIITGQIHHHSGRGNKSANILTELKKTKYVDHIVGCSPQEILTADNVLNKMDEYLKSL